MSINLDDSVTVLLEKFEDPSVKIVAFLRDVGLYHACSEDEARACDMFLREAGFQVYEAAYGEEARKIVGAMGGVDVVIANAGFSVSGALAKLTLDDHRRQFETNVFGLIRMSQLVLPGMREQRAGRHRPGRTDPLGREDGAILGVERAPPATATTSWKANTILRCCAE